MYVPVYVFTYVQILLLLSFIVKFSNDLPAVKLMVPLVFLHYSPVIDNLTTDGYEQIFIWNFAWQRVATIPSLSSLI